MITHHCRACGIEKYEEGLFKCDWCSGYFCGLHFDIHEDGCDGCLYIISEDYQYIWRYP